MDRLKRNIKFNSLLHKYLRYINIYFKLHTEIHDDA